MDQLPLDRNPVPGTGPRNLTVPLAAWLRKMGFTVLEQGGTVPTALAAAWKPFLARWTYELTYCFRPGLTGIVRLTKTTPNDWAHLSGYFQKDVAVLVELAEVNRLREVRLLLLSNFSYAEARAIELAAGTLKPAHLTTT